MATNPDNEDTVDVEVVIRERLTLTVPRSLWLAYLNEDDENASDAACSELDEAVLDELRGISFDYAGPETP